MINSNMKSDELYSMCEHFMSQLEELAVSVENPSYKEILSNMVCEFDDIRNIIKAYPEGNDGLE